MRFFLHQTETGDMFQAGRDCFRSDLCPLAVLLRTSLCSPAPRPPAALLCVKSNLTIADKPRRRSRCCSAAAMHPARSAGFQVPLMVPFTGGCSASLFFLASDDELIRINQQHQEQTSSSGLNSQTFCILSPSRLLVRGRSGDRNIPVSLTGATTLISHASWKETGSISNLLVPPGDLRDPSSDPGWEESVL